MSYELQLLEAVRQKIASWNLPKRLQDEITYRLKEDLTDQPARYLRSIPGPERGLEYSFVTDGGDPHAQYLFAFRVLYSRDRSALVIDDCEYLCERSDAG
jgi:hypothetical protein